VDGEKSVKRRLIGGNNSESDDGSSPFPLRVAQGGTLEEQRGREDLA